MEKSKKPERILNAFESVKARVSISDEMSQEAQKTKSRLHARKLDLSPRQFNIYSRAVDAAGVAQAPLSDDVSRATSRARRARP